MQRGPLRWSRDTHRWSWALAVGFCLSPGAPATAQTIEAPAEFDEVREYIERGVEDGKAPSVAVGVVRDGALIWAQGFGWADMERRIAATPDSIYRLASISKPITATGMMLQVEAGDLDLDRPANDYLEGAALRAPHADAAEMTLRRLANHSSGLPVHYHFYYDGTEPLPLPEVIRRHGFASHPPGTRWEYSNLAFGILNHIVAKVSGRAWNDYMIAEVYDPLGMSRTSAGIRQGYGGDAVVQYGRDAAGRFFPVEHYRFDHPGGSAVCSTVHDLARFARFHLQQGELDGVRLLSTGSVRQMQEPTFRRSPDTHVGIAWFISRERGRRVISHGGGMPGVSTILRIYPDDQAAVIVLTNSDDGTLRTELPRRIGRVLFPEDERHDHDEQQEDMPPSSAETEAEEAVEQDPPGHDTLAGEWRGHVEHFQGDIPLELAIGEDGTAQLRFGERSYGVPGTLASGDGGAARWQGGLPAMYLRLQEGYHGPAMLEFDLRLQEDRCLGTMVARVAGYCALSHFVELAREDDSADARESGNGEEGSAGRSADHNPGPGAR